MEQKNPIINIEEQARIAQLKKVQEADQKRFDDVSNDIIRILKQHNILMVEIPRVIQTLTGRVNKYIDNASVDEIMTLGIKQNAK